LQQAAVARVMYNVHICNRYGNTYAAPSADAVRLFQRTVCRGVVFYGYCYSQ
jgi:hypothetical protein